MKIAQIAPLAESVPPKLYGGTERVVSYLTEELVRLGHDVTLFASVDAETLAPLTLMLEQVRRRAHEFDILHFHVEHLHFPLFLPLARKTVTTVHRRLDHAEVAAFYREFDDMPLVSISASQRAPLPSANWIGTVHYGLAEEICPFNPAFNLSARSGYFAFLGRVSPGNGLDRAIEIARRAGVRLRIAAKVDREDEEYFRTHIVPLLAAPGIEFIGEVNAGEKPAFLGNATALVAPIDGPEPFSLAMIEAMSCGTPVIAGPHGSAAEVIEDGRTGFIVDSTEAAIAALGRAPRLNRLAVRSRFEERFSAARMAQGYLSVYRALGRRRAIAAI